MPTFLDLDMNLDLEFFSRCRVLVWWDGQRKNRSVKTYFFFNSVWIAGANGRRSKEEGK